MNKSEIQEKIEENKRLIKNLRDENKRLELQKKEIIEVERVEKYSDKIRKLYKELAEILKDAKKVANPVENIADIEADQYLKSVEENIEYVMKDISVQEEVENFINDPAVVWTSRPNYVQTRSSFECPDCGEKLDVRIFSGGRVLLTCNEGFKKTGCKYGYIVRRN